MITTVELRRLLGAHPGPLLIDAEGAPMDGNGLPPDAPVPGLLVAPITEAVKQVEEGMIAHFISRDTLWAIDGYLLDQDVIADLPEDVGSGAELISAVRAAGREWRLVQREADPL